MWKRGGRGAQAGAGRPREPAGGQGQDGGPDRVQILGTVTPNACGWPAGKESLKSLSFIRIRIGFKGWRRVELFKEE